MLCFSYCNSVLQNSVGHRRSFPSTKSSDSKNQLKAPDVSVSEYARGMKEYRREVQAAEDAILGPGEEVSWAEKFFAVFTVNTFALLMSFACIALDFRIRYQVGILKIFCSLATIVTSVQLFISHLFSLCRPKSYHLLYWHLQQLTHDSKVLAAI